VLFLSPSMETSINRRAEDMTQRILVVDDEASVRFGLSAYFTARGYDVESAADGRDAQAMLRMSAYDLVISDLCLEGRNCRQGLDVIRYARLRHPEVRTILLTAHSSPEIETEVRRIGGDTLIPKAVPLAVVADAVSGLLKDSRTI
jgi:DNA-binding response OmpR family regulator